MASPGCPIPVCELGSISEIPTGAAARLGPTCCPCGAGVGGAPTHALPGDPGNGGVKPGVKRAGERSHGRRWMWGMKSNSGVSVNLAWRVGAGEGRRGKRMSLQDQSGLGDCKGEGRDDGQETKVIKETVGTEREGKGMGGGGVATRESVRREKGGRTKMVARRRESNDQKK